MELQVQEISLKRFTYVKPDGHPTSYPSLVSEASDLGHVNLQQRLYDDACDVGFAIRSHKTNHVERFYFEKCDFDKEGEVVGFIYKPVNKKCRIQEVLIIND